MGIALLSFLVIFILLASGGMLLFYRQPVVQRISTVVTSRAEISELSDTPHSKAAWFRGVLQQLERVVPKSQAEMSVVKQRLTRAGFRGESAVKMFYGAKAICPVLVCLGAVASGFTDTAPSSAM